MDKLRSLYADVSIKFHLVDVLIFGLFFNLGVGSLFLFSNSGLLTSFIDVADLVLDAALLLLFSKKVKNTQCPAAVVTLLLIGVISAYCSRSIIILKAILLIVSLKGESYVQVIERARAGLVIAVVLGLVTVLFGMDSEEEFRRNGMAFGFGQPNQAALYFSLILMMGYSINEYKKQSIIMVCIEFLLIGLVIGTGSKTALVAIVGSYILARLFTRKIFASRAIEHTVLSFPIIIFVFSIVSAVFLYDVPVFQVLNDFFTGRLWLNQFALSNFHITLFGQTIDLHVSGVYNDLLNWGNITTTVDCAYVASLLCYGLVGIVLILGTIMASLRNAWRAKSSGVVSAAIVLCFYAFTESVVFSPLVFFPVLSLFTSLKQETTGE